MGSLRIFFIFFAALVLIACSNNTPKTLEADTLISVVVNKGKSSRHDLMPAEAKDLLATLKLDPQDGPPNVVGSSPAGKIKIFDVAAYAEYSDGWLIASGYGEWGGIVFWLSRNGDYKIIRDDDLAYPIDAIADQNTIFLIQGMNHLSLSEGHLLEINRYAGDFETKEYPVNGYPTAFEAVDGQ